MKALALLLFLALFGLATGKCLAQTPQPSVGKPFRLIFKAYDGRRGIDPVEKFDFQIETIDYRQPSAFLKLGDRIPNTKLKLLNYEYKVTLQAKNQDEREDLSELTVINSVTGKTAVLVLNKVTDVSALLRGTP